MPLDLRSALPTVPGIPAWGAVVVAAGLTFIGFVFDAVSGSELTSIFSTLYFLGCLLAVLAVRHRGLFTAVVQPPLVLFVAVPLAQQLLVDNAGTGIKDLALNVAYPLVNRFPLMLAATVVVALVAGARVFLAQQDRATAPTRTRTRRSEARPGRAQASADRRARTRRAPQGAPRDEREAPIDRRTRSRRGTTADPRAGRPAPEPAMAHSPRGYRDPAARDPRRHDPSYREPVRRESVRHEPVPRDPIPARTRPSAPTDDVPAHPVPRVRYRDRREPPVDR